MSNTPYVTTDLLKHQGATQYQTLSFFGATGSAGPVAVTAATAGTDAVATSLRAALVALGLVV